MADCLCDICTALCCRYFALPIETPETAADFDDIRWYISHEGISIFVEEGDWFINIANKCKNLTQDNRCAIYETRPRICRQYSTSECDYHGGDYGYQHLFTSIEQIEAYAKQYLTKKRTRSGGNGKLKPRSRRRGARHGVKPLMLLRAAKGK